MGPIRFLCAKPLDNKRLKARGKRNKEGEKQRENERKQGGRDTAARPDRDHPLVFCLSNAMTAFFLAAMSTKETPQESFDLSTSRYMLLF
jgi:hypothetical protein